MECVYFRQEVLTKYEGAFGFEVEDNGSVSCRGYWGLVRSTRRLGNELLATAIGDFAEGVPFEEWPHWRQYAVEPPSQDVEAALGEEQTVPAAVNSLCHALDELNAGFAVTSGGLGVAISGPLWRGSLDSLAGRQLKWVYPADADDDEFLKRATLTSTLVIDELHPKSLRQFLKAVGQNLHLDDADPPQPLGSRNLLQRLTLIAVIFEHVQPDIATIPLLVKQAEGKATTRGDSGLQAELAKLNGRVRDELGPLAFLYDLRTHGGLAHPPDKKLAHPPDKKKAASAAAQLGITTENWHRSHYLRLLNLVAGSARQISEHLKDAAQALARG